MYRINTGRTCYYVKKTDQREEVEDTNDREDGNGENRIKCHRN